LAKGSKKKGVDSSGNGGNAPQKMTRKEFEIELAKLQIELTRLQAWAVAEGARVIVVFEGRDTAGKGGVISRIMQRCSPRVFKHIALPTPSDREKSQLYMQRYIAPFPRSRRDRPVRSVLVQPGWRRAGHGVLQR
jgi:polyphosphate kinase